MAISPLNNKPVSNKEFRIKKILDIIVIVLLVISVGFLIKEMQIVKQEGGQCVNNPMAWAEHRIHEEKDILVDCGCRILSKNVNLSGFNPTSELNSTNNTQNGKI